MALMRAVQLALAVVILASEAPAAATAAIRPAPMSNSVQVSSPMPRPQPSLAQHVQAIPPRDLADLLLAVPFPVVGLPFGIDNALVLPLTDTDVAEVEGLVQGVTVQDPDHPFPFASYLVFASADEAVRSIDRTIAETGDGTSETVSMPEYDAAAWLAGDDGFRLCQVPVAKVVVSGLATSDDPDEGREAALA